MQNDKIENPCSFLDLYTCSVVTESPRWLLSRGKYAEAEKIIRNVAEVNDKKLPDPLFNEAEMVKHMVSITVSMGADVMSRRQVQDYFNNKNVKIVKCCGHIWYHHGECIQIRPNKMYLIGVTDRPYLPCSPYIFLIIFPKKEEKKYKKMSHFLSL